MELGDVSFIAFYAWLIRLNAESRVWRHCGREQIRVIRPFASEFLVNLQHM